MNWDSESVKSEKGATVDVYGDVSEIWAFPGKQEELLEVDCGCFCKFIFLWIEL